MSTSFPSAIDSYSAKVDGSDYPQAAHINNPQDAIVALETKVGIDSSVVATSLDYLIKSTVGGHRHDGSTSRKVLVTSLDVTGLTVNQVLRVNSGGTAVESAGFGVPTSTIVGVSDSQTLTNKTITQPTLTLKQGSAPTPTAEGDIQWDTDDNRIVVGDGASQKTFTDQERIWPIGSIYLAVVSTNPATLLGFGTWSQIAQGQMLVGQKSSDTDFDTAEETGGSKTATIAAGNLPELTVTVTDPGHDHPIARGNAGGSGGFRYDAVNAGNTDTQSALTGITAVANPSGANTPMSVMNPYFVAYIWKRTA